MIRPCIKLQHVRLARDESRLTHFGEIFALVACQEPLSLSQIDHEPPPATPATYVTSLNWLIALQRILL